MRRLREVEAIAHYCLLIIYGNVVIKRDFLAKLTQENRDLNPKVRSVVILQVVILK